MTESFTNRKLKNKGRSHLKKARRRQHQTTPPTDLPPTLLSGQEVKAQMELTTSSTDLPPALSNGQKEKKAEMEHTTPSTDLPPTTTTTSTTDAEANNARFESKSCDASISLHSMDVCVLDECITVVYVVSVLTCY